MGSVLREGGITMGNGRKGGEIGGGTRRGGGLRVTRPTNYLTLDALEFYLFVPQGFSRCKSSPCELCL